MSNGVVGGGQGGDAPGMDGPPGPYLRSYAAAGPYRMLNPQIIGVLRFANGRTHVAWPDARNGRPPWSRPATITELLSGRHRTTFAIRLPARGARHFFQAEVDVMWWVVDPLVVDQCHVWNVARVLEPVVLHLLRGVTQRFPIGEAESAQEAIEKALVAARYGPVGADLGLGTRMFVRLDVDEARIQYAVESDRQEHEGRLAAQREADVLRKLGRGEVAEAAMQIGQDPASLGRVLDGLRAGRQDERQAARELIEHMLQTGVLQAHQLTGPAQVALDMLDQAVEVVSGRPAGPPVAIESTRVDIDESARPPARSKWARTRDDDDDEDGPVDAPRPIASPAPASEPMPTLAAPPDGGEPARTASPWTEPGPGVSVPSAATRGAPEPSDAGRGAPERSDAAWTEPARREPAWNDAAPREPVWDEPERGRPVRNEDTRGEPGWAETGPRGAVRYEPSRTGDTGREDSRPDGRSDDLAGRGRRGNEFDWGTA